jgi:adenylate cyclase
LARFWAYTPESAAEAGALFGRALELDPAFASAHAWLARTLVFQWVMFWDSQDGTVERALEHAHAAVDLGPQLPSAHAVVCWVQLWRKQTEASLAAGRRAVALDPNNADAHLFLSLSLSAAGRGEEALHLIEKGMRLNPHTSAFFQYALGQSFYVLEDYERAIAAAVRGVELLPAFIPNRYLLCIMYALLDKRPETHAERDAILAITRGRVPVVRPIWLDDELAARNRALLRLAGLSA